MTYGKAKELKVKLIQDYTDWSAEEKLNRFFEENPQIEVIDIKVQYRPDYTDQYLYGHEYAMMVIYREPNPHEFGFDPFAKKLTPLEIMNSAQKNSK